MHIEPGVVNGAKLMLGAITAGGAATYSFKLILDSFKRENALSILVRGLMASVLVFCFFQVLPHYPVGVSEVHFILGSTLFLLFGASAAAIGLTFGLLLQGIFFAPTDLPQLGMNLTTLLVPLFALNVLAKKIIAEDVAYKDISYKQSLKFSAIYQAGIVSWVAFWSVYGSGFGVETLTAVMAFAASYSVVVVVEPLLDLLLLGAIKNHESIVGESKLVNSRVLG
jgi:ABC-type Co2+ transport system permease subunit